MKTKTEFFPECSLGQGQNEDKAAYELLGDSRGGISVILGKVSTAVDGRDQNL